MMEPKSHKNLADDKYVIVVLFIIFFLIFLNRLSAQPYIYTSNDNNSPNRELWSDASTWTISSDPGWIEDTPQRTNKPDETHGNVDGIDIYGYTYRNGNIVTTSASPLYQIFDTLYVDGDMTLASSASMLIPENGLLVVKGDLTLDGEFDLTNNGTIVATGDLMVDNGVLENNNELYVYGDTGVNGGGTISDGTTECKAWFSCNPEDYSKTETDLQNENQPLYDFVDTGSGNTLLPITLHNFEANAGSTHVGLIWSTIEEENFDYFVVEHSTNGTSFQTIGKVFGAGYSKRLLEYDYQHGNPTLGWNYYRLTAIDVDGSQETFKPVSAFVKGMDESKIYPNPGNGNTFNYLLSNKNTLDDKAHLEIRNLEGKLVYHTEINNYQGKIHMNQLEDGIYIVEIKMTSKKRQFKYLVR